MAKRYKNKDHLTQLLQRANDMQDDEDGSKFNRVSEQFNKRLVAPSAFKDFEFWGVSVTLRPHAVTHEISPPGADGPVPVLYTLRVSFDGAKFRMDFGWVGDTWMLDVCSFWDDEYYDGAPESFTDSPAIDLGNVLAQTRIWLDEGQDEYDIICSMQENCRV